LIHRTAYHYSRTSSTRETKLVKEEAIKKIPASWQEKSSIFGIANDMAYRGNVMDKQRIAHEENTPDHKCAYFGVCKSYVNCALGTCERCHPSRPKLHVYHSIPCSKDAKDAKDAKDYVWVGEKWE